MLIRLCRITILLFLLAGQCYASTYTTTQDGSWNTDSTWGGGGHPTNNDDIAVIGHKVTYDAGVSAVTWGNVTINSGGMLCFPTTQSSKIIFNATAILTVNSGGELRTGTTSTVGAVGAAYTLRFEWPQGATSRYVLVLNDGAIVNIQGVDVTQYAYLDADWTSGQSFYVEGDYSSLWAAGQTFYIHVNAAYVTNGYQTQGKTYTIASVGAYDAGNDRTQITISEAAPGITFAATYEGHRSKLILVTRNVVLCDPGASLAVYGYGSYAERIQCDLNQTSANRLVDFWNCLFYGWDRCFDGGFRLQSIGCCFINNGTVQYGGADSTLGADFLSNSTISGGTYCTAKKLIGDVCSNFISIGSTTLANSEHTIVGDAIGNYGVFLQSSNSILIGNCVSCYSLFDGTSITNCSIVGDVIGVTTIAIRSNRCCVTGDIRDSTVAIQPGYTQSFVFEDSTISGVDRFPLRVYTNAGNVLPLDSVDTDWQAPESGNAWIMQEIPNSYCTYDTFVNQVPYSPINPMMVYVQARPTTLTLKIWPVGWTASLDQDDVVLEVKYLDSASGITRTTAYNTSQTYANGAWRSCSVTFTPSQAGVVYFQLYFRSYEPGGYVLIDPMWKVE